jgi:hypothetical protein
LRKHTTIAKNMCLQEKCVIHKDKQYWSHGFHLAQDKKLFKIEAQLTPRSLSLIVM